MRNIPRKIWQVHIREEHCLHLLRFQVQKISDKTSKREIDRQGPTLSTGGKKDTLFSFHSICSVNHSCGTKFSLCSRKHMKGKTQRYHGGLSGRDLLKLVLVRLAREALANVESDL